MGKCPKISRNVAPRHGGAPPRGVVQNAKKGPNSMPRVFLTAITCLLVLASMTLAGCPPKPATPLVPVPAFKISATSGTVPLTVQFTDQSLSGPTPIVAWRWAFGDGTLSSQRNPRKTYTMAGNFTVSLTVTTSQGNFERVMPNLIQVKDPTTFGTLGGLGGTVTAQGVSITVPAGVLKAETVFGVDDSADPAPLPSTENTLRISNTFTIQHNHPVNDLYAVGFDGKVRPSLVRVPLLAGAAPAGASASGQLFLLARLDSGRTLPIPALADGDAVTAKVMRLPRRASYTAVYRPGSQVLRARDYADEAKADEATDPLRRWPDTWKLSGSEPLLQQLTALRLGDIRNEYTFGRRNFTEAQLGDTGAGLLSGMQDIHDDFVEAESRHPALIEEDDAYMLVLFNMQDRYPNRIERLSDLAYRDDFFGHLVLDPAQLLAVASNSASLLAADPENEDIAQVLGMATAFVEGLFTGVYRAYQFPDITTTGVTGLLPAPADRDAEGNVRAAHFLNGVRLGGGTYLSQSYENNPPRSFAEGQFARLSTPLLFPYSPVIADYAPSGQEFFFYLENMQNDPAEDPDYESPLYVLAGTLEGVRAVLDEFALQGRTPRFEEALILTYRVMNAVMEETLPQYYWDFALERAYENGAGSLLRPMDRLRPAFTLNEDRFDEDGVARVVLSAPSEQAEVNVVDYPAMGGMLPLSARAIVFETNALSTELTLTFNADEWRTDVYDNSMAVKIYRAGSDGVELSQPAGVYGDFELADTDEDGVNDTVRIRGLRFGDDPCGAEIVVVAANLNLGDTNSLEVAARAATVLDIPEESVLRAYVHACDPSFSYRLRNTISSPSRGFTSYLLEMTSGVWRGAQEVYEPEWRHYVTVVEPTNISARTAMLVISGGSTGSLPSESLGAVLLPFARSTGSAVALLQAVPNQPLNFTDQTRSRSEDAIIAYSYDKYLDSFMAGEPDMAWPALLPMTRAAVRAMDAVQGFMATKSTGAVMLDKFVVTGASKRGWTTWLTAAADNRVSAAVPIVIDVLNMERQMEHHRRAYSGYETEDASNFIHGGYSTAIKDYVDMEVFDRFGSEQSASLLKIVDPLSYRNVLTMPKLIANSTGDQFFLPDSSQFYLDQMPGKNYLYYAPNTDHGLSNSGVDLDEGTLASILAFYIAHIRNTNASAGDNVTVPQFTWRFETDEENGKARIIVTSREQAALVRLWQATNPDQRDFRLQTLGAQWNATVLKSNCMLACEESLGDCPCDPFAANQVYTAEVDIPQAGWIGFFVQVVYPGPDPAQPTVPFAFSTPVRVVPDTYPDE